MPGAVHAQEHAGPGGACVLGGWGVPEGVRDQNS